MFRGQTDIFVHMLPTSPGLLVPQLTHGTQNDIVMARQDIVAAVDAAGFVAPGALRPAFRGRLVLATRMDARDDVTRTGPFALTDPSPGAGRDDAAILAAMGLRVAHALGAVDSGGVAYLVATGAAGAGLMLLADVRQDVRLKVAIEVPETAAAPIIYVASATRAPLRAQPGRFLEFLGGDEGVAIMKRHGWEKAA